jgi:alpha-galactosidase
MSGRKIVCLGGGSLYFRRALPDLLISPDLAGSEIVLYDIDEEKVQMMAQMGSRLAERAGTGLKVRSTVDLTDAVDGADFALSSIGGSGAEITRNVYDSNFHNADIRIPAKYGITQVIGDTCGPAGMMMALRSIPAYIHICREMEKRCPNVILFNHSNPMAVLCRAMHKHTDINVIGICHGVQEGLAYAAEILEIPVADLSCDWIGTNHYFWFTRVMNKTIDVYPELMQRVANRRAPEGRQLSASLSQIYGHHIVYPSDDHIVEFYPFLTQTSGDTHSLPYGMTESLKHHDYDPSKPPPSTEPPGPEVKASFFESYKKLLDGVELPEKPDDSITGEGLASLIGDIVHGRRRVHIVNVANQGAIPNLPPTAEVELEGVTDWSGVRPIQTGDAPPILKGILEKRFVWHELVADAAVTGDRGLALQALMVDEMSILPEKAEAMLEKLLLASRDLLPKFFE